MKRFFLARSPREQGLLLLFGVAALAWWGVAVAGRAERLAAGWRNYRETKAAQGLWLKNRDTILARVAAAGRSFDPARTLDAAGTFAVLNGMLQGLHAELGSQRTERTAQFAVHSVQIEIRRASLADLLRFCRQLSAQAPYIAIEQCTLEDDRTNPGMLNARLIVYSVGAIRPENEGATSAQTRG